VNVSLHSSAIVENDVIWPDSAPARRNRRPVCGACARSIPLPNCSNGAGDCWAAMMKLTETLLKREL